MTVHKCDYRVIYGDTDGMGIVYYANYLRIFEMARAEYFRDLIRDPMEMVNDDLYLIVVKSFVHYLSPATFDERLIINSWIPSARVKQASFQFNHLITEEKTGREIVTGYTVHAMTTREGKLKRMSREFLRKIHSVAAAHAPIEDFRF